MFIIVLQYDFMSEKTDDVQEVNRNNVKKLLAISLSISRIHKCLAIEISIASLIIRKKWSVLYVFY